MGGEVTRILQSLTGGSGKLYRDSIKILLPSRGEKDDCSLNSLAGNFLFPIVFS